MAQSILLNTAVAMVGRVGTLVLGLVAVGLSTRLMAVSDFGVYSLALTIGTFLQLIADFGLYLTASKELGGGAKSEITMGHIISLRIMFLIAVFVAGCVGFLVLPSTRIHIGLFALCALGLSFQSISQLLMSVFQARGVVWRATVGDLIGRAGQVAFLLFLGGNTLYARISPISVALTFAFGLLVALGVHIVLAPAKNILIPTISLAVWKKIIGVSWPIGLLLVLNVIYFRIDTLMIAVLRSSEEVGLYALAYKIVENTLFFPAMLGGLMLPHISSALRAKNRTRVRLLVEQALLASFSLALPTVALLVVFAGDITIFISGSNFAPSGPILSVLAFACGIMFIGNILGFVLIALNRQRALMKLYAALIVGNIAGNLLLIPHFGAFGAAWATVVTEGVATAFAAFLVHKNIQWKLSYNLFFRGLVSMGAALAVGMMLPENIHIAVRLISICALYGAIGYYNGMWNTSTLGLLKSSRGV